jgi:hypothetical protein
VTEPDTSVLETKSGARFAPAILGLALAAGHLVDSQDCQQPYPNFDNLHSIIDHDRTSHWSSAQTSFFLFVLKTCDQPWATAWCVVKSPIPVLILVPRVLSPARRNTGASASVLRSQNQASRRDHQKRSMRRVLLPFFCISMLIRSLERGILCPHQTPSLQKHTMRITCIFATMPGEFARLQTPRKSMRHGKYTRNIERSPINYARVCFRSPVSSVHLIG